jgi:hypothetical protein
MHLNTRIPFLVALVLLIVVLFYLLVSRDSGPLRPSPAGEEAQPTTPLPELPQY